jgi:transposase
MDQVHVVRHKVLVEGRTQRSVARELGMSRVTVRKYVDQAAPSRLETAPRERPVWEAVGPRIEALLAESGQWTGGKQRLTATRLHQLVRAEGHQVGVTLVKDAVAEWKRQRREVMIPLTYRAGDLAEVDFFEVLIDLNGARRKAWLFLLRLMYSGRDFGWIYERQDQVSFLDGHVRAFAHVGVPARIAYDNLRPAVTRILVGGERTLTGRFAAVASHYLFEPCFCRPGVGHDKGGVEARGKAIRTQALVPIPSGATLEAINDALLAQLDARVETRRAGSDDTIGVRFAEEQRRLRPVDVAFIAELATITTILPRALARVEGAFYSVPCRWAGLDLTAWIGATTVVIVGPDGRRIPHPRLRFGQRSIDYRHYLPMLAQKPQAVRQVLPDLLRDLGAPFHDVWDHLHGLHGPRDAARLFAKILGQLETQGAARIIPALTTALAHGTPLLLALTPATRPLELSRDVLPRLLRDVTVDRGCAADYDRWLQGGVQ